MAPRARSRYTGANRETRAVPIESKDVLRRMNMQPELQPIRTGGSLPAQDYAVQQHRVLRNTYWLLALSLIPTVIGAAIGTNLDFGFMRASPILRFVQIAAPMTVGISDSARSQ